MLAPLNKAATFTNDLATIAKQHGLSPNLGHSTDDKGHIYYVLEANGNWMRIWSTNMPLSGNENPVVCGHYTQSHPDPGQYVITIDHGLGWLGLNHVLGMISSSKPKELMSEVSGELRASGYSVKSDPAMCSSLSKLQSALE